MYKIGFTCNGLKLNHSLVKHTFFAIHLPVPRAVSLSIDSLAFYFTIESETVV